MDKSNNRRKEIKTGVILLVIYFLGLDFLSALSIDIGKNSYLVNVALYFFLTGICIFVTRADFKSSILEIKGNFLKSLFTLVLFFLFSFGLVFLIYNFAGSFFSDFGSSRNEDLLNNEETLNPRLFAVYAVVLAPILEEIIFRVSIFKIFGFKIITIFISVLIFVGLHIVIPGTSGIVILKESLLYLPLAISLSVLYYYKRNIFLNISLHMLNNLIAVFGAIHLGLK